MEILSIFNTLILVFKYLFEFLMEKNIDTISIEYSE